MKYKDICKNYGFRFIFPSDKGYLPYMVIDINESRYHHVIVNLLTGKIAIFKADDKIMDDEVQEIPYK
jgi:hypothetical protein